MITLNGIGVHEGFSGIVKLGEVDKLFVAGDGRSHTLYGTLFKQGRESVVIPPSESATLTPGSIKGFLMEKVRQRSDLVEEIARLEDVKADVSEGKYDYGVSKRLVDDLLFLSNNTAKPLPSCILGGHLAYEDLNKCNYEEKAFEEEWVSWSHTGSGLKRYQGDV